MIFVSEVLRLTAAAHPCLRSLGRLAALAFKQPELSTFFSGWKFFCFVTHTR